MTAMTYNRLRRALAWTLAEGRHTPAALIMLLAVYCVLYASLLVAGDFVPYVFDNNESFSTLNHARNLVEFGIGESAGLADEAVGPAPAAHPVVHTHQGNMPRLFAAVLYLAGLRSVESQIAVTTFTIGTAVVIMAFSFFRNCVGTGFALLASLILITDYIFFAQWHVNTYRVWIPFFVLSSLLTAEKYATTRRPLWLALIAANSLLLFYYELVFALFVAVMTALYMTWRLRDSWLHLCLSWTAFGFGGAMSLGILIFQVASYLGWQDMLRDAELTYFARNFGENSVAYLETLKSFYREHDVVFFYNIASAGAQGWWSSLWEVLIGQHMRVVTPFVGVMVVIALSGYASRCIAKDLSKRRTITGRLSDYAFAIAVVLTSLFALLILGLFWLSSLWSMRADSGMGQVAGAIGAAITVAIVIAGSQRAISALAPSAHQGVAATRFACCLIFLIAVALWVWSEGSLYSRLSRTLWSQALVAPGGELWQTGCILAAVLAWGTAILLPRPGADNGSDRSRLYLFFASGAIAALIVYAFFPGYVRTGYLHRGETFLAVHLAAAIAFALYVSFGLAREYHVRARIMAPLRDRSGIARKARLALGTGAVLTTLGSAAIVLQWVYSQYAYVRFFPPDQFSWLKRLKQEPYRGASVVSNNYATPFAVTTGGWGYIDTRLATGGFEKTRDGFQPVRSDHYVWLADRQINTAYRRPDILVCFLGIGFDEVARRFDGDRVNGCRDLGLVKETLEENWRPFRHRLVAMDKSPRNAWAIVRLDWTASPYLLPLSQARQPVFVAVNVGQGAEGTHALNVWYRYAHQDGHREAGTMIRVYRANTIRNGCSALPPHAGAGPPGEILVELTGANIAKLPGSVQGSVVVSVRPASAQRAGKEYFSDVIDLGGADGEC